MKTKKKIIDISKPVSKKSAPTALSEDFKKFDKKIGKKLEKEIEEFEFKQEEKFNKEKKPERKKRKFSRTAYIFSTLVFFLLAGTVYAGIEFLPKATIKIITEKTDWAYNDSIIAGEKEDHLLAEIFSIKRNFNFSFQALGRKQVEKKARGRIIIYNVFSSSPQLLVAGTRFETPDKKIFRLTERITVPGARVVDGKINPSSIEATVIADQPGPQYNIGPINRFSIPGFFQTPKEKGFYAESKKPMEEGFVGELSYPTEDDIKKAKERAKKELKNHIDSYFFIQVPQNFKFIENSKEFNILKEEVNTEIDEKGNFTVFVEGELKAIGFKESDLLILMEKMAQNSLGEKFRIKSYQTEYGAGRPDFRRGKISFALNFKGVFEEPLNIENFKQKILEKNEEELKDLISSYYPNIEKTTGSFWPFWVKRVPDNLNRIIMEVE